MHKPWAAFRVSLFDCNVGKIVWTAQGNSSGHAHNDQEDLWQSVSDTSVTSLSRAGLLPR